MVCGFSGVARHENGPKDNAHRFERKQKTGLSFGCLPFPLFVYSSTGDNGMYMGV